MTDSFDPAHKFPRLSHDGIKVRNLNVRIGDANILKDVSLDIPRGQVTCIIGPSGCGKSTLLRTFNRLVDSAPGVKIEGEVMLGDRDIARAAGEADDGRGPEPGSRASAPLPAAHVDL